MLGKKSIISVATSVACLVVLTACGGSGHAKSPVAVTSPTPTPTSTPTPITYKIQVIDAYAIGEYKECVSIDGNNLPKGKIEGNGFLTFLENSEISKDAIIKIEKNCMQQDVTNNKILDKNDTNISLELSSFLTNKLGTLVTPLTTWLVVMKEAGNTVDENLTKAILGFNPVAAATTIATKGTDATLAYNLLILSEILKANAEITSGTLSDINMTTLTTRKLIISDVPKIGKIKELINALNLLSKIKAEDLAKINVETFIVALMDGNMGKREAWLFAGKDGGLTEAQLLAYLTIPDLTPTPTPTPIPAKVDLTDAKVNFGNNISVELDANNHFVAEVEAGTQVADFYDLNLSSFSIDKNFEAAPTTVEITIIDDNNASNIEKLVMKITGAIVDNKAGEELTTTIPVGATIVTKKTNNDGTKTSSKPNKKERKQVGLEVHLGDLIDEDNEKEKDYLDTLQSYLDATGNTYDYTMKVTSDAFEPIEVTGDIKTQ